MRWDRTRVVGMILLVVGLALGRTALAQSVPWDVFADPDSLEVCDLVNAANAELVVLSDTGQFVIVTGVDVIMEDTFVDPDGLAHFLGIPFGFVEFAADGDGIPRLWLLSITGTVWEVDAFSGQPVETNFVPGDFVDVPCDACELWDDPFDCLIDDDLDGVDDRFDLCLDTPLDELADDDGCSCSQLDDDLDGVDDCFDECPDTPLDEFVDDFGCACFQLDSDGDDIDDCFDECPLTPRDELADLDGCSCSQVDDDLDGIDNCDDLCPNSFDDVPIGDDGCPCLDDADGDGIVDCFDECPATPADEPADIDGCSCRQLDDDRDGIDNCDDLCPNSSRGAEVDVDGCEIASPPIVIGICGSAGNLALAMTLCGLVGLQWTRRRV